MATVSVTRQYQPFREGQKAGALATLYYESSFAIRMGLKFVANKLARVFQVFKRSICGRGNEGFDPSTFATWQVSRESLGIGLDHLLTPYELARSLGCSKTPKEIRKELEQVPTRVIGGHKIVGEAEEGSRKKFFNRQLGIAEDSPRLTSPTPFTKALSDDAGVWQGYSVGTHTLMVIRMFDQHLAERFLKGDKFNGIVSIQEFRLFLLLHDIGKGLAVREEGNFETKERKRKELQYCQDAIDKMVEQRVFSQDKGDLFKALLADVTIGKYLKNEITLEQAVQEIQKAMEDHEIKNMISCRRFFRLCKLFHIADAGAYKSLRRIDGLLEIDETGRVRHSKTGAGAELDVLKQALPE